MKLDRVLFISPQSQLLYIGFIVFMFLFSIDSNAQDDDCEYLTTEKSLKNRTIRKSKMPIIFKVTDEVTMKMIFTNSGYPNTLMAELTFEEDSGFLVDLGNILTMNFADGTQIDFIISSRRSFTSVAYFTLMKPANKRAKKVMTFEDRLLYERFIESSIISLEYSIDNKKQKIIVVSDQAEFIKNTVQCLIFN